MSVYTGIIESAFKEGVHESNDIKEIIKIGFDAF